MKFFLFLIFLLHSKNALKSTQSSCQSLIYKCCNGSVIFTGNASNLSCCNRAPYDSSNDMVYLILEK